MLLVRIITVITPLKKDSDMKGRVSSKGGVRVLERVSVRFTGRSPEDSAQS